MGDPDTYFVSQEQIKEDEDRDENMSKVIVPLDLLTKYVIDSSSKAVNVIAFKRPKTYGDNDAKELDAEIRYLSNQIGGSHLPIKGKVGIKVRRKEIVIGEIVIVIKIRGIKNRWG